MGHKLDIYVQIAPTASKAGYYSNSLIIVCKELTSLPNKTAVCKVMSRFVVVYVCRIQRANRFAN